MHETLSQKFDAVVMLTFSKWHTEMRSNRYHYATRFARHLPVIFVQPDLEEPGFRYEPTEVRGMSLLHLYSRYGWKQNGLLNAALVQRVGVDEDLHIHVIRDGEAAIDGDGGRTPVLMKLQAACPGLDLLYETRRQACLFPAQNSCSGPGFP